MEFWVHINIVIFYYYYLIHLSFFFLTNLRFKKERLEGFAYDLVIGGAVGNIFDRIIRGGVFDFIYFHYESYGFPVFNLADTFISIGFFIIICTNIIEKQKPIA